jgi:hypothetical protein
LVKLVIDGAGDFFGVPCSTEACLDTLCCRHWKIYKQLKMKLLLLPYTVAALLPGLPLSPLLLLKPEKACGYSSLLTTD